MQEAAQYLLTAFRRLVRLSAPSGDAEQRADVFVQPPAAATAAGATINDIDMLVDAPHAYAADKDTDADPRRPLLSADDAVLLAAALARHLGPLMEDSYLVSRYVLPVLQVQSPSLISPLCARLGRLYKGRTRPMLPRCTSRLSASAVTSVRS